MMRDSRASMKNKKKEFASLKELKMDDVKDLVEISIMYMKDNYQGYDKEKIEERL